MTQPLRNTHTNKHFHDNSVNRNACIYYMLAPVAVIYVYCYESFIFCSYYDFISILI